jgi:hypothetical protein
MNIGFFAIGLANLSFAEADAWLEMSGAKSHEPFLHVERAELARLRGDYTACQREPREAHRLFLEIGAPIRAEQRCCARAARTICTPTMCRSATR